MKKLQRGLYEVLVDEDLQAQLADLVEGRVVDREPIDANEAADRFALHIQRLARRALTAVGKDERVELGMRLARTVIALLQGAPHTGIDAGDTLIEDGEMLRAVAERLPDGRAESITPPATPLLDTTLLTNAPGEPRIGYQLQSEIDSSDRIDVLMAFVRRSGVRPLLDLLGQHCAAGRPLRLLTTTYTGSTELAALEALQKLGADIRVSYDTSGTRLHAKAWLFHRASGFSTAYIGSSNLTHSAQVTGLEWNVRVSGARNPDVIDKFAAVFDACWESGDFRPFAADEFRKFTATSRDDSRYALSPIELAAKPFQARMLEQIELAERRGQHRNLLVSATGTGKTVMAALYYQRLRGTLPRARLLFVAHRRELLDQARATFRIALRDSAFGELWVGDQHPARFEYVFASIQSLAHADFAHIAPDHFDVVIVDEFHHAAAPTYDALLSHLEPRELLGLTATPERADGKSILSWFGGHIAAELRIWDAIDQGRLSPFEYYGISDGLDLTRLGWKRGRGYDIHELDGVVTGNEVLARLVIHQTRGHVADIAHMRALGFCVSVAHAEFMAHQFSQAGVAATVVSATTPTPVRDEALRSLASGKLQIVFAVDLFNEGVDIPSVDTLLLLRPTDSATIFLQQLGRGLRKAPPKTVCTVLDFVSQHRKEFRFANRLGALLNGTRKQLIAQVEAGFPWLPSGCNMELDRVASAAILRNLRDGLPTRWNAQIRELERIARDRGRPRLAEFLEETGLALEDVYSGGRGWSELLEAAGVRTAPAGPQETDLRRALGRLLHVDDDQRTDFFRQLSQRDGPPSDESLGDTQRCLARMLAASLFKAAELKELATVAGALRRLWQHPQVLAELGELMEVLASTGSHVPIALARPGDNALRIHARYSRPEILAALGTGDGVAISTWREGTRWFPDQQTDVAVVTLDKSGTRFSPTTRYRDYAIERSLIHWESQSTIRAASPTGQRYQQHRGTDTAFLLFARLTPADRAFWLLGPATYVSHEGERPMAITWRLVHPLPGDLYAEFAAAV